MNTPFWQTPPWHGGVAKQRLGLRPVDHHQWFNQQPDPRILHNKHEQLLENYAEVVAVTTGSEPAQALLADLPGRTSITLSDAPEFPDAIARAAWQIAEDLCFIDVPDEQKLIAACVCAPSYWRIQHKLGLPLAAVHAPVQGMRARIGAQVQQFIEQAPLAQPFERRNWFMHGDGELFHPQPEKSLTLPVSQWFVRSERQTLCRLSERYLLFTIEVISEPLSHISEFATARADLLKSLARMDLDEIDHFGGVEKHSRLTEYVSLLTE